MDESEKISVAILGSTRGSALRPIVAEWKKGTLPVDLSVVISNRKSAPILEYAREQGIEAVHVSAKDRGREEFDREVSRELKQLGIQVILMIGYMRIVSKPFVDEWRGCLVNIHPSLLPRHGGLMDLDVHKAVLEAGDDESGCTLHLVEEKVDAGRIVLQKRCSVSPAETPDSLKNKVQKLEAEAFLELLGSPRKFLTIPPAS